MGAYGSTPAPMNSELQEKVLDGRPVITCRPADELNPEFEKQKSDLLSLAKEEGVTLLNEEDDTLTYALFPQVGWKFLKNRNNPSVFEPMPSADAAAPNETIPNSKESGLYTVEVEGKSYSVRITDGDDSVKTETLSATAGNVKKSMVAEDKEPQAIDIIAPLAGNVFTVRVKVGDQVRKGDTVLVLEAMKMETDIRANFSGKVSSINIKDGDSVKVGDVLLRIG